MSPSVIAFSVLTLGGVSFVFAILIAVTHRKFKVWEDPRIDAVANMLPNSNCGACGQAGCRAFAELAVKGTITPAECTVMNDEAKADVAAYLGVGVGEATKRVARLLCAGGSDVASQVAEYRGYQTCKAASAIAGGGKACAWGCLGYGDCEVVCDFDAIYMNRNRLPVVIPALCTACGDCVETCPKDLFTLMPMDYKLIVQCKSLLEGDEAVAACAVACNACGRCALDAAPGVVAMVNGLAVVDYTKNDATGPEAIARCPTGAIVWLEGAQFQQRTPVPELKEATV